MLDAGTTCARTSIAATSESSTRTGSAGGEYEALAPYLERLENVRRVLDAGPGMGRSTVFFKNVMSRDDVHFDLYEGAGDSTWYTDFEALDTVLRNNRGSDAHIVDASGIDARLSTLQGPYDFVYSFFAIGFHWSILHFLDELLGVMHPKRSSPTSPTGSSSSARAGRVTGPAGSWFSAPPRRA